MNRLVYRNFGDHEALLVSHAVAAGTGGGVRFYELRNPATTPTIFQQGTFAPDSAFRWMSSMAFDGSGNIGMGYSISSSALNIRPSIRYTGRLTTDALGTMGQGEATIVAGGGSQINNLTRWGDYSSLNIDPTDDCTFWYTGEYMGANGSFNWRTRVGAFRFAACGQASNDFSITPNPTSQTVNAGASTIYEINTAVLSGTAQTINLSVSKLPAGVTGTFKPASVTAGTSSTLTLAVAPATSVGTTQFTITGTDTLLTTHTTTASVTVIPNEPPTVTITSPINGSTVSGTVAVSVNASDTDGMVASVRFDLPDGASVSASAPFSITWNSKTVPNGNYEITATAIDNLGATSESTVTVTVANSDFSITPDPTLQTITAGARTTYTINTAVLSGIAQTIELSVSGLPAGVTGSFNPASVTAGSSSTLTLTSSATTAAGTTQFTITGTATAAKHTTNASVTVTPNEPPTVTVTSPTSGSVVSGTVTVSASASDSDGIASVKFDLPDGTSVFDTLAPFSTTWDSTSVPEGSGYLIHATASDNRGVVSVATVTIAVNNCVNNTFSAEDVPIAIPDNEISGITSSIPVTGNGTVASLLLSLDITHTFRGDLVVNLISPDSAVFSVSNRDGDSNDDIIFTNLAVSTFNGEPAAGTWQLSVQDRSPGSTGTLNSWSLAIVGTCPQITHWASTATPNLPTIDNGTACTNLTVSTGGSSSGAKLDIFGRHDFRSTLGGTLAHNGATVAAFPTGTFPSGGGTFSFTNRSAPGLSGDASGTWTLCIIDTDGLGDTGVLTAWSVHD
jgi:subtilisin-like proprotein convertase family protein